jgi:hypothetical protein
VTLRQLAGALPDPVGHVLVVDLLGQGHDVAHLVPGHERERGFPGRIDMPGVLRAADPEVDLLPGHVREIPRPEHLAGSQPPREVIDRRAAHQRVVHVEERAGRRVRDRRRLLDLRGGGGGRASRLRAGAAALAQQEPRAGQGPAKRRNLVAGTSHQPAGARHQRGSARHDRPVTQHPHTGIHVTRAGLPRLVSANA